MTSPVAAELLKLADCADEVLAVGRFKHSELLKPGVLYRSAKVSSELRKSDFDLAIEFSANTETGIILQLAHPRHRLHGTKTLNKGLGMILERFTRSILQRPPKLIHLAQEYLRMLEPLGVRPLEAEPRLVTDRVSDEFIEKLLRKHSADFGELLVGIHPGAGAAKQSWPMERFASIGARMIYNFDARVMVFSGPWERGAAKKLAEKLPAKRAIVIESPKLADFVSAAARLSLFIANHSGPAHIAAAGGAPVVAISQTSGPSSRDLLGAQHKHLRGSHVELISEEEVYEAACQLLKISRAEILRTR